MGFIKDVKDGAKGLADKVSGHYGEITLDVSSTEIYPGYKLGYNILIVATDRFKAKRVLLRLKGLAEQDKSEKSGEGEAEYSQSGGHMSPSLRPESARTRPNESASQCGWTRWRPARS